ncbi:hypothetical protein HDV05_000901 [Chytridiales sp. JEL 0842]|nr:hypothetical protein HDV05_000901 [Chytridiales sp. JEL 0842]
MPNRRDRDPRREEGITAYIPPRLPESQSDGDPIGFFGVVFSLVGMILRYPTFSWLSLLCSLCSYLNTRGSDREFRQGVWSIAFAVMTLFMIYGQNYALRLQEMAKAASANGL